MKIHQGQSLDKLETPMKLTCRLIVHQQEQVFPFSFFSASHTPVSPISRSSSLSLSWRLRYSRVKIVYVCIAQNAIAYGGKEGKPEAAMSSNSPHSFEVQLHVTRIKS
ncbi:unnamed protein product [Lactuca virosa]|uniref:Peptidylprolyl isomerase n=1 Tax=Lactuca virosa TaxID=75947 RepID=A0AAU9LLJ8_9ASTR|nr:unnamed protein product [Lactuca virosa]